MDEIKNLKDLVVRQATSCFTPKVVFNLPEELQILIRRNMNRSEQVEAFNGEAIEYFSWSLFQIERIAQYYPYYTIGIECMFWDNGNLYKYGYWYKQNPCWVHRYWRRNGKLKFLRTYNKHGILHGAYKSYSKTGKLKQKGNFVNGCCGRMIRRFNKSHYSCVYEMKTMKEGDIYRHGSYFSLDNRGRLTKIGEYDKGNFVGTWRSYAYNNNNNHNILMTMSYTKPTCNKIIYLQ